MARRRRSEGERTGKKSQKLRYYEMIERVPWYERPVMIFGRDVETLTVILVVLALAVGVTIGYLYYNYEYKARDENDGFDYVPPKFAEGVKLEVVSDETHQFGSAANHDVDLNGQTGYLLLITNTGTVESTYQIRYNTPTNWDVSVERSSYTIPAGKTRVCIANVSVGSGASVVGNKAVVTFTVASMKDPKVNASVETRTTVRDLGSKVVSWGDDVNTHYTLIDRGTDDKYDAELWAFNQEGEFKLTYDPATKKYGAIDGYAQGVMGMKVGQTKVFRIPSELAYGDDKTDGRPDGELVYEITVTGIG